MFLGYILEHFGINFKFLIIKWNFFRMEKSWRMKEIVSVNLFYVVKSPNFQVL
jgi:hypothetical protein